MIKDIVQTFYKRRFETKVNENMLEYDYSFPDDEVMDYINTITAVPMDSFLNEAFDQGNDLIITTSDLLQFSSLDDATTVICNKYSEEGDPGFSAEETGRLLLNDKNAKKLAYRKYGENHAKAAEALGLVYSITNVYFLSCLGTKYTKLERSTANKLLTRMVLRTNEIYQLYRNYKEKGHTDARSYMGMLSDSTYRRRRSNLRRLLLVLKDSTEYDFSEFINSIYIL